MRPTPCCHAVVTVRSLDTNAKGGVAAQPGPRRQQSESDHHSGLAQPLIGQFGTLGRNVLRLNPLIEFDPALSRQFAIQST